jgi:hypothetical protein
MGVEAVGLGDVEPTGLPEPPSTRLAAGMSAHVNCFESASLEQSVLAQNWFLPGKICIRNSLHALGYLR